MTRELCANIFCIVSLLLVTAMAVSLVVPRLKKYSGDILSILWIWVLSGTVGFITFQLHFAGPNP